MNEQIDDLDFEKAIEVYRQTTRTTNTIRRKLF